jgi:hypothetical protein
MYAERLILETDANGCLKPLPQLPPNVQWEAIFLGLTKRHLPSTSNRRRQPSAQIASQGRILGDLITPVITPAEWEALT